ncbi:ATP-binding protein [Novosphingobium sp. B1]|uniref:ATP-binding protein n=1 Tax=Novosphingobium sp. B1 TaxID=1938756 RepID=UPI0009D7EC51|nr:ATP-binding protein [Novosphingobium sp. B1]SMC30832.1 Histidine kinase-, DNA gyrase B-, and HSP90-like ATPase [Novosphingobium sp. B1]
MLAALQVRLGGSYPGLVAIPSLLAVVRRARVSGARLDAHLTVEDAGQPFVFDASVCPDADGTEITISGWQLASQAWDGAEKDSADEALLRQLAEAHVVLDREQRIIAGSTFGGDLAQFEQDLRGGFGRYWTDVVSLEGSSHRQPLHWRLLDGVGLRVPGSHRTWRACILPLKGGGFELLLIAETVLAASADEVQSGPPAPVSSAGDFKGLLGQRLAPALRLPLNRIVANSESIRTRLAGPLDPQYVGYAADIAQAGRHLLSLVEDLADLDTVEEESFQPAVDDIDLVDCARRAAGILGMRAQEKHIALVLPDAAITAPACAEFRRVLQILLNLIGNALRYSPQDTTVRVEAGSASDHAWISVIDEGEGIPPNQVEQVFEKFERLGRSGDGGSGLGLYISRKLARAMGGELSVTAADNGGARFTLTLPLRGEDKRSAIG